MPQVGFEPTIPVFERAKTVHALDCAATVTDSRIRYERKICTDFKISQQHSYGSRIYKMPDCWLEVSPAARQLHQSLPWFSCALQKMLSWYPNSHVALLASRAEDYFEGTTGSPKRRKSVACLNDIGIF
jgi:hypothetical protein